jgi:DNA-binding cell septation regulator SpoVG
MIKITWVEFFGESRQNFIRYATIVIDGGLAIKGLKLIRRPDKSILIAMPSRKKIDDTHEDIAYPISQECRDLIELEVLKAWDRLQTATSQNKTNDNGK